MSEIFCRLTVFLIIHFGLVFLRKSQKIGIKFVRSILVEVNPKIMIFMILY